MVFGIVNPFPTAMAFLLTYFILQASDLPFIIFFCLGVLAVFFDPVDRKALPVWLQQFSFSSFILSPQRACSHAWFGSAHIAFDLVPRLSLLCLVVGRKTLVAAGHVTICDQPTEAKLVMSISTTHGQIHLWNSLVLIILSFTQVKLNIQLFQKRLLPWSVMRDAWCMHGTRYIARGALWYIVIVSGNLK